MMIDKKFEGIIWFRPLSCSPEIMVEPVIKGLCEENDIPLLVVDVDDTNAESNVISRIDTFFELIEQRTK